MINIDTSGVREVQARIAAIQEQFGLPPRVPGMDFSRTLQQAMQKAEAAAGNQAAPQPESVERSKEAAAPKEVQLTMASPYRSYADNGEIVLADAALSELVREAAAKYSVDPKLLSAIAEVESGGSQFAQSDAGAVGVMQLMPDTAASLGVNPYDEKQNVEGGAKYLRQMLDSFGGDVQKAVAAYNAGPRAVQEYGGVPPYRETQDYVDKVLDIYR